jgi:lysophospholipid acyltransferase (LPLAT)-like uncharacterized protein
VSIGGSRKITSAHGNQPDSPLKPTPHRLSWRDRFLAFGVSAAGWAAVQFIGRTSRIKVVSSPGYRDRIERGRPVIYAFWHRYQVLMLFVHRGEGVHVLVSQSKDGELIAQTLHRLGFRTVRGSSSRGGTGALLKLMDVVKAGGSVAFTPDGPRGPVRSVQPGVLALAAKMEIPVVPLAWAGRRVKELGSWDRFLIPKPFGRYAVVYGEPTFFSESGPAAEEKLKNLLIAVESQAQSALSDL